MRPETRPEQPYTREQILRHLHQHFVVDGNPRCADDENECRYSLTGCAVGCLLTAEDADLIERNEGGVRVTDVRRYFPDLYAAYFDDSDVTLELLRRLQSAHDYCPDTTRLIAQLRIEFTAAGLEWPGGGE